MNEIDLLISLVLASIMFGIGTSIKLDDFKTTFKKKKPLIIGLFLQMIALPLFAVSIAIFSNLSPELKVGLFIVSICPGGTTSNFISYIINADIALSIALTTINSILILLTIPLLSSLALDFFLGNQTIIELSINDTFSQVFFILILPAILGISLNHKFPKFLTKVQKPLKLINTLLLGTVFGIKLLAAEESGGSGITQNEVNQLLPYCLLLHFGAMLISFLFSKKIGIDQLKAITIGIEVGLQNTTLAILVTGTLIGNNQMTNPALVVAMFTFFSTLGFALIAINRTLIPYKVLKK